MLTQIAAVVSGTEKVGLRLVREHVRSTLGEAPDDKVDDILRVVERFLQA